MWFLIGLPIVCSALQITAFGFHFSQIFFLIARTCMIFRAYGSKVKMGVCITFELISDFLMLVRPLLTRKPISALEIIISLLISIVLICILLVDNLMYVYVEENADNESNSHEN